MPARVPWFLFHGGRNQLDRNVLDGPDAQTVDGTDVEETLGELENILGDSFNLLVLENCFFVLHSEELSIFLYICFPLI